VKRAYAILTIKAVDAEQRVITGIATSATPDSMDDVVEPDGAQFKLPIPLLWQHDSRQPIGEVYAAKVTDAGIEIKARLAKTDEPGALKTRLDDAWQSIKLGLVKGLSIGFKSLEESYDKTTGGYHFLKWLWLELSAVTIPANADASILSIKAASGRHPSGVSDTSRVVQMRYETHMKKSFADQIASWEATRAAKSARMDELLTKSGDAGVTLDDAEQEEHDTLEAEVIKIDKQLVMLRSADEREKKAAKPVSGRTPEDGSLSRTSVVLVEKKLPPGIQFARYAMCVGMARGNEYEAKQIAKDNYGDDAYGLIKLIELQQKAAVGGAATSVTGWASELVPYNIMDDFIAYLRPRTILGKFGTSVDVGGSTGSVTYPSLRRVPFNTRVAGFSAGTTAAWVGEGLPILLSKATSFTTSLTWSKIAALAVLTKEEIRFSNPNAESKVRDDLAAAVITKMDKDLIDPVRAAVANVNPASLTWNTTPVLTTGATAAAFRTDMATLISTFATALLSPEDIVLIMSTGQALNISLMLSSLGVPVFPGLTMSGGYLLGFPVITTSAMVSIGSPVSEIIVAVKAGEIYLADDGVVTVDASDQASVEMVDTSSQSGVSGTGASLVSFWQSGLLGLKATREVNWKLRRAAAARYLYNVAYKA
jgi:HK97 family phage major capsid protein/HK97 family phage prohead protease